jgi:hypothetical protein
VGLNGILIQLLSDVIEPVYRGRSENGQERIGDYLSIGRCLPNGHPLVFPKDGGSPFKSDLLIAAQLVGAEVFFM